MRPAFALLIAFLSGSIPTALLLGRMKGIDLRKTGSGNLGATNVFRTLGWKFGVACLLFDMFKAWGPAVFLKGAPWAPEGIATQTWMLLVGLAAVLGHSFSPWVGFKGGKGVASSLGTFIAVAPLPSLICFALGVLIIVVTGYVSLASITGATLLPLLILLFAPADAKPWPVIALGGVIGVFVIWKHRANIGRLRAGNENRLNLFKRGDGAEK